MILIAVAHYLAALEFQKEIVKIQTLFGVKNPYPNYVVGGMAGAIDSNKAIQLSHFHDELVANVKTGDYQAFNSERREPSNWTKECKGFGYTEAPRGSLCHWIRIENGNHRGMAVTTQARTKLS